MDLSIIVPIYNIDNYLQQCIDSLLKQETKYHYEIILVDDGSTDKSSKICDSYNMNQKIRVFHNKNNGVSFSRNFGFKQARGNIITFFDGDDYCTSEYVNTICNFFLNDLDILCFAGKYVKNENVYGNIKSDYITTNIVSGKEYLVDGFNNGNLITVFPWIYAFKRSFLEMHKIEFEEDLIVSEDFNYVLKAIAVASRIYVCDKQIYIYRIRDGSVSRTVSKDKMLMDLVQKKKAYDKYMFSGISDLWMFHSLQVSRLKSKFERKEVIEFIKGNKYIMKSVSKRNMVFGKRLVNIFGYTVGSYLYLLIQKIRSKFKIKR